MAKRVGTKITHTKTGKFIKITKSTMVTFPVGRYELYNCNITEQLFIRDIKTNTYVPLGFLAVVHMEYEVL